MSDNQIRLNVRMTLQLVVYRHAVPQVIVEELRNTWNGFSITIIDLVLQHADAVRIPFRQLARECALPPALFDQTSRDMSKLGRKIPMNV
jgi:hypothetical protein